MLPIRAHVHHLGVALALAMGAWTGLPAPARAQGNPAPDFDESFVVECVHCTTPSTLVIPKAHERAVAPHAARMFRMAEIPGWVTDSSPAPLPRNAGCERIREAFWQINHWANRYHSYYVALGLGATYRRVNQGRVRDFDPGTNAHENAQTRYRAMMNAAFQTQRSVIDAGVEKGCLKAEADR